MIQDSGLLLAFSSFAEVLLYRAYFIIKMISKTCFGAMIVASATACMSDSQCSAKTECCYLNTCKESDSDGCLSSRI